MRRGMADADVTRRLRANRTFSIAMSALALIGLGAFVSSAGSSARVERDLRAEFIQLKASQDQLLSKHKELQERAGDLLELQAKLASVRNELETLARAREHALGQVAAARQDLAAVNKRLENRLAKVPETGRVRAAERTTGAARATAPTKSKT